MVTMRACLLVLCLIYRVADSTCPSDAGGLASFATSYPNPTTSTDVNITSATLLDVTSLDVNTIVISGIGQLIFKPGSDITIRTKSILIKDDGQFVIGSEDCRFEDDVDISLHGTRTTDRASLTGRGEKFIAVEDNGSLKIYGRDKLPWTKLTSTLNMPAFEYRHQTDSSVNAQFVGSEGLTMTVFDSSLTRTSFAVYDFWKADADKEQIQVDKMVTAVNGLQDGDVVAIALQNYMKVSVGVDLSALFTTIESAAGLTSNSLALRTSEMYDAFALVFKKGSLFDQCVDELIGKDTTVARASIEAYGKKLTAVSTIKAGVKGSSNIDTIIASLTDGYPVLNVADSVSSEWLIGDSVVVASTDYSWKHAEVRRIKGFPTPNSVQLDHELMYRHYGAIEQGIDMRAEVGVLSRNIKIHAELSRGCPTENENCDKFKYYDTYGCHIKMIHSFKFCHIEGVELYHCGQPTDMGFYPIHFHMCANVTTLEAVVKRNSIHDTFQRAITVHGTYGTSEELPGVELLQNVAYNVFGHCYFLEDGGEIATVLRENLAVSIKKIANSFNFVTDAKKPTAYWITTPEAVLIGNVAAGSEGIGFWYTFPDVPVGPSSNLNVYQDKEASMTKLYTIDNNVAHSNDLGGFNFDNILTNEFGNVASCMRYNPLVNPLDKESAVDPVFIYRLTAFKNRAINVWLRGGGFYVFQCSLAESKRGIQLATGGPQHQYMSNCVIMGESEGNHEYIDGYPDAFGKTTNGVKDFDHYLGIVFYDGPVWISNSYLTGFKSKDDNSIVAGALGFKPKNKFSSSITTTVSNLQFGGDDGTEENWIFDGHKTDDGVNGFGNFDGDEVACFRDADGSVVKCPDYQYGGPYQIFKPEAFIQTDKSLYRSNWKMSWSTDLYCKLNFDVQLPKTGFDSYSQMRRVNRVNASELVYEDCDGEFNKEYMAVLNRTDTYIYEFQYVNGFPDKLKVEGKGVARDENVIVGVCLPEGVSKDDVYVKTSTPNDISFDNSGDGIVWVNDIETLTEDTTMSRALLKDRFLYVHLTNRHVRNPHWDKYDDNHCPGDWCPNVLIEFKNGVPTYAPCFTPTEAELNTDISIGATEDCVMAKGVRKESWGAGDTLSSRDGAWRTWSSWSDCCNTASQTTQQTRYRNCSFPTPYGPDGQDCPADEPSTETRDCTVSCPVDGTFSDWTRWSDCSCMLGTSGVKTRTRSCDGTSNGGQYCKGSTTETNTCNADCS